MQTFERTLGRLQCVVVDTVAEHETVELAVVLCHGFGASGTDLVGLAPELCHVAPQLVGRTRFIFPAAPLALDDVGMPGARAWWHLDLDVLNNAINSGEFRDQRQTTPDGLDEARLLLSELVEAITSEWKLGSESIVLGGFSQGSMIATDVALSMDAPPAALCIWSGTLLCEDTWRGLAENRGPLRVFQSHGRTDPILPYAAAEWLRDLLDESGLEVDFLAFPGVHTIPMEAVEKMGSLLEDALGG
jgi:phospholipase/carboxylesterase